MSNFPHSASLSASLSTSPFAVQTNLESLINRARNNPLSGAARRLSDATDVDHPSGSNARYYEGGYVSGPHGHRPNTIREVSYDEGAIFLEEDDEHEANERTGLMSQPHSRRTSRGRRTSYGTTSEPLKDSLLKGVHRNSLSMSSAPGHGHDKKAGNSRSRSKVRSPPREPRGEEDGPSSETHDDRRSIRSHRSNRSNATARGLGSGGYRGRDVEERPLSPMMALTKARRESVASWFNGDDSSGDDGGDVTRGLLAPGGGPMMGAGHGLGGTGMVASGMDFDPAEELDCEDLELPVDEQGLEVRVWSDAMRAEIPIILRLSLPVFFTQMAEWSLVLASVISIGHLGTTELAAASLASMTASVSSFSILQGLAAAMDTLLPAAWTSSDPSRVGLWTQRMAVVMTVSMIPMFVLWWNVEGILLKLGQEAQVAHLAANYLRWLSIGIPGYGGTVLIKKYLQAQGLMSVPTYSLFIVAPLNVLFNYLFVWGPKSIRLGFSGGALATSISYTLNFLFCFTWAMMYGPQEARYPFKLSHVFSKLGTVTSLGLAGTIMVSSEWWAWEACALAASMLGPVSLAAQSCLLSTTSTFFQVPASLGIASAVRTGNLLGAGRDWEAKWASRTSLIMSVFFSALNGVVCMAFKKNWGYLFNNDPEVVAIVASIMPYIALFQITDGVGCAAGAILRSLGLHTTGALINLTSYYIIGLPFGLWLCFTPRFGLGLIGIWIGLSIALGYGSVVSAYLVWNANWTRAVERVRERLGLPGHVDVGPDGKVDYGSDEEREGDNFAYRAIGSNAMPPIDEIEERYEHVTEIVLPAPADFHVHLRQGAMSRLVTPHVAQGGIKTAYVMPNLVPPLTSTKAVLAYKADLESIDSSTEYLMTLYLHPEVTPAEIKKAAKAGIKGVKSYPRGVTTNSGSGIENYEVYYPVFKAMEDAGMVLNLHGEVPSDHEQNISILNAEKHFLAHLTKIATSFPKLRIVLEHATTSEAVNAVLSLPSNVACSITAHHLELTIDAVPGQPFHFCKPVAKEPKDRDALRRAVLSGNLKFFLGSDSAPHPVNAKTAKVEEFGEPVGCAAGVYTSSILVPLVATLLESFGALDKLQGFVSDNGRKFYGVPAKEGEEITLRRVQEGEGKVPGLMRGDGAEVVPFWAGKELGWEIV